MLGCMLVYVRYVRFSFEAYAKSVREKATKCSLKTTDILLVADRHALTYVWYL